MNILMRRLFVFCLILCSVFFPCLLLIITGNATIFIDSYAVDSNDRLYVGKEGKIDVYDNGNFQYSIDSRTSKSCAFTINEDDCIVLSTASHIYILTLQGEELSVYEDPGSSMYARLQIGKRTFHSKNGDTYKRVCFWGRTKIIKNNEQIVYQMDFLSFTVKILIFGSVIALFCFVCFTAVNKTGKDRDKRQGTVPYPDG